MGLPAPRDWRPGPPPERVPAVPPLPLRRPGRYSLTIVFLLVFQILLLIAALAAFGQNDGAILAYRVQMLERSVEMLQGEHGKITALLIANLGGIVVTLVTYILLQRKRM